MGMRRSGGNWNEITLHHSGSEDPDPSDGRRDTPRGITLAELRRIHVEGNGWSDVGYHFLIGNGYDLAGRMTDEAPDGAILEGRSLDFVGAHVRNRNSGRIGICLAGNFEDMYPTKKQLASLLQLLKDLRERFGDLPLRPHCFVNARPTDCPGKHLLDIASRLRLFSPDVVTS